jgi:hypothetical protein
MDLERTEVRNDWAVESLETSRTESEVNSWETDPSVEVAAVDPGGGAIGEGANVVVSRCVETLSYF